jgi:hypothetical protein
MGKFCDSVQGFLKSGIQMLHQSVSKIQVSSRGAADALYLAGLSVSRKLDPLAFGDKEHFPRRGISAKWIRERYSEYLD